MRRARFPISRRSWSYPWQGEVLASTDARSVGLDFSESPVFLKGKDGNSATTLINESGVPKLFLSGPLLLEDELLGVLIVRSTTSAFDQVVLDRSGLGETGETIVSVRHEGQPTSITPLRSDAGDGPRTLTIDPWVGSGNAGRLIEATDYRSLPVLVVAEAIPDTDLGVIVKIDEADAMAPLAGLRNLILISAVAASLIAIGVSFFLSRVVTQPIQGLTETAKKIAEGDLGRRIERTSRDEIGTLGQAFNQMADQLIEWNAVLETRVKEKTQALEDTNRDLSVANDRLQETMAETEERRAQVADLLDSSGQGFLSFGPDFKIHAEFSRACLDFFGAPPVGRDVGDLLHPDDEENAGLLRSVIAEAGKGDDPFRRDMMLSLLPPRIERESRILQMEVKVPARDRFMIVLTDVSEEVALQQRVHVERKNLEMIVAAVVDRHDFFLGVQGFADLMAAFGLAGGALPDGLSMDALFRRVHTVKGVLSQFGFPRTTEALHALEGSLSEGRTALSAGGQASAEAAQGLEQRLAAFGIDAAFDADIAVVRDALGDAYIEQGGMIPLAPELARSLSALAGRLLRREEVDWSSPSIADVLSETSRLSKVGLAQVLHGHDRLVQQLAERYGKEIDPIIVSGPDIWIDMDRYQEFLGTLVHLFRNAVFHGIEQPEDREQAGKPVAGRITCELALNGQTLCLSIADDGVGIDIAALRSRLAETESFRTAVNGLSDADLLEHIFHDGVSTAEMVDDVAGRGVGLAAVRAALSELDGRLSVRTDLGRGTWFLCEIPVTGMEVVAAGSDGSVKAEQRDDLCSKRS